MIVLLERVKSGVNFGAYWVVRSARNGRVLMVDEHVFPASSDGGARRAAMEAEAYRRGWTIVERRRYAVLGTDGQGGPLSVGAYQTLRRAIAVAKKFGEAMVEDQWQNYAVVYRWNRPVMWGGK